MVINEILAFRLLKRLTTSDDESCSPPEFIWRRVTTAQWSSPAVPRKHISLKLTISVSIYK